MDKISKEVGYSYTSVKERSPTSVKLCGYLKKKRNIGGWRKMWFVLQDKLLLSYGSKEEYDNKLVSFKDALNLVPGTLVRPLGGFRFTIETTSQAIYTFHCDDRSAYREWITVLLDSLALQPSVTLQKFSHRFCHFSVDNIPNALSSCTTTCSLVRNSTTMYSYDSISHVERSILPSRPPLQPPPTVGGVRLPIAHNTATAKILERNGANPTDLLQMPCNRGANPSYARTRNQEEYSFKHFCLHNKNNNNNGNVEMQQKCTATKLCQRISTSPSPQTAQSVRMIDRMFHASRRQNDEILQLNSSRLNVAHAELPPFTDGPSNCEGKQSVAELPPFKICSSNSEENQRHSKLLSQQHKFESNCHRGAPSKEMVSCCTKDCKTSLGVVKDKIQRMHIKGSKELTLNEQSESVAEQQRSKVVTTASVEQVIMQKECPSESVDAKGSGTEHAAELAKTGANNSAPEPIYAVVDLKHKYAHRKARNSNMELKRCNSYDSILQISFIDERHEKTNSMTLEDTEGIYEDGDTMPTNKNVTTSSEGLEEENIYEPINVPASTPTNNTFWKCFSRLKVNPFAHFTDMSKRGSGTYDSITLPASQQSRSRFSSIKQKFGTHRKSMQVKMRKLYAHAYQPKPFFRHNQQNGRSTSRTLPLPLPTKLVGSNKKTNNKKSKYFWKSVKMRPNYMKKCNEEDTSIKTEKRFFDSLPHLTKARVSLFAVQHLPADSTSSGAATPGCEHTI